MLPCPVALCRIRMTLCHCRLCLSIFWFWNSGRDQARNLFEARETCSGYWLSAGSAGRKHLVGERKAWRNAEALARVPRLGRAGDAGRRGGTPLGGSRVRLSNPSTAARRGRPSRSRAPSGCGRTPGGEPAQGEGRGGWSKEECPRGRYSRC